jgi:hypothetical protein
MKQHVKRLLSMVFVVGLAVKCAAFSLLGPFDTYQVVRIGYNPLNTDIGGPMNLGEEYRWNVKTIYYGFDSSFINYFGAKGTSAVEQAVAVFNALPAVSTTSTNLSEFPMSSLRYNYQAQALNLLDVKSLTMACLLEEMGVTSSERYTWTLRVRNENPLVYTVIKRNFDPVTWQPSSYVNGVLFTYSIQEFTGPVFADAVESRVDPLQTAVTVADTMGSLYNASASAFEAGAYFTGLTRDDIGGLKYIYRPDNYNWETLPPNTLGQLGGGGGGAWVPIGGTETGTNAPSAVNQAIRPGVDKISFVRGNYDSLIGTFVATTNFYTDYYVSNSVLRGQSVARAILQPDILFLAEDLGLAEGYYPNTIRRTVTAGWGNNAAINGQAAWAGPGQITPQVRISYNNIGPFIINTTGGFLDEYNNAGIGFVWGSYDGTTNEPVVFPNGSSIGELEQQILFGSGSGSGPDGSAWTIPNSTVTTNSTETTP